MKWTSKSKTFTFLLTLGAFLFLVEFAVIHKSTPSASLNQQPQWGVVNSELLQQFMKDVKDKLVEIQAKQEQLNTRILIEHNRRSTRNDHHVNSHKRENYIKWMRDYKQFHDQSMRTTLSRKKARYVFCQGLNGYGNAFQSIVSCFLYAMMSNRVFLLEDSHLWSYSDYFKEPIIDYFNHEPIRNKKAQRLDPDSLACIDFSDHDNLQLVILAGNWGWDYFGQTLQVNPHYNLTQHLPTDFFKLTFHFLFQLRDELEEKIEDFKQTFFGDFTIGIQIRAVITKTHSTGEFYKGKKDHEGHPIPPTTLFGQTAELLSHQQTKAPYDRVKWFIATQNLSFVEQLQETYGEEKVIFYEGKITTTFDSDVEGQNVSFLTWMLLGECDEIITTESSSYGVVAAARAGIYPVVCNHGRWCARKLTTEPCQQTPWFEDSLYPIQPHDCLRGQKNEWNSVESSCAYFEAIIRQDAKYEKGVDW